MSEGVIVVSLFYDPNTNQIQHEDGRILDDISHLISHNELAYLKVVGGTQYIESDEEGIMYELNAPIPENDELITFYYDTEQNVMLDSEGYVMFNIFSYVMPSIITLFKTKKEDMRVFGKNGRLVELIYGTKRVTPEETLHLEY